MQLVTQFIQEVLLTLKVGNSQRIFGQPYSIEADSNPVTRNLDCDRRVLSFLAAAIQEHGESQ